MTTRALVLALLLTLSALASACAHQARCPDAARRVERRILAGLDSDGADTESFCLLDSLRHPKVGPYLRRSPDGVVIERGVYGPDGRRRGLWQRFWRDGTHRWEAEYANGRQHGVWRAWHPNGRKASEGRFLDGKRHGPWTRWRDDGGVEETGTYAHGLKEGAWKEYHPNGRLAGAGRYVGGERIHWTTYRPDGRARTTPTPEVATADACWEVVRRACMLLRPEECRALAALLSRANVDATERQHCSAMLRDANLFNDMLTDLMVQWRVQRQP